MLEKISVHGYKAINNETVNIKPLTLIVGPNSTGKSSLMQSIFIASIIKENEPQEILNDYIQFSNVSNRFIDADEIDFSIKDNEIYKEIKITDKNDIRVKNNAIYKNYEKNLFYLSANRIGINNLEKLPTSNTKIGFDGKYAVGSLEIYKDKPIYEKLLVSQADSNTLKSQLSWWLSEITGMQCNVQTSKIETKTEVSLKYTINGIDDLLPINVGTGSNYLLKVLIMCLLAKPDDILLIENPEIHLHPFAQSKIGSFFTHIVKAGIQLIIETHCEHLINGIRYEIFKKRLNNTDTNILYKSSLNSDFTEINYNEKGAFIDSQSKICKFPDGFFDAMITELMEMF